MLLTIKDVSAWLNIKPSTLYLWAAQGKIPCQKIHGLIRFDQEKLIGWLESFDRKPPAMVPSLSRANRSDVDQLIEAAKRDVYTPRHGETRPTASPKGKEVDNGAR
jgi:excisionase family DNA binding protein